jgi:hypothetical protein
MTDPTLLHLHMQITLVQRIVMVLVTTVFIVSFFPWKPFRHIRRCRGYIIVPLCFLTGAVVAAEIIKTALWPAPGWAAIIFVTILLPIGLAFEIEAQRFGWFDKKEEEEKEEKE